VVLNSTSQGSHLLGENAASRIAQLNILDALFVAIAQEGPKDSGEESDENPAGGSGPSGILEWVKF
jgi:DNA-binding MurR/RpiR family transcriptional regulator